VWTADQYRVVSALVDEAIGLRTINQNIRK
jgi:hypothetical protein